MSDRSARLACTGAVLLLALASCTEPSDDARPLRVVLLGDSITEGKARPGVPYADLLVDQLGPSYELVNIGLGGTSSLDWRQGSPPMKQDGVWLEPSSPFSKEGIPVLPADVVTVLLGTNDARGFYEPRPVSSSEYQAALEKIIENLLEHGAETVMLMTAPPRCGPVLNERLAAYRDVVIALCAARAEVVCGPDLFELLDNSHFDDCDPHPNAAGHALIATELARALRECAQRD
jgi:lysophospholipase L1-like esterase